MPMVVLETPFKDHPASNWTLEYLSTRADDIGHVLCKKGVSPVFKYFASDQPLSENDATVQEKDYVEAIYKAKTFFDLLRQETKDQHYYYASGGLEMLNLGNLTTDDSIFNSMTFPSHSKAFSTSGQVNFWMGKGEVTAYTHYDTSYNLHYVVRGRKRFLLLPPEAHSQLELYPCLHQWYRQVGAMDIPKLLKGDQPQLNALLRKLGGFDVEVVSGGAIYIPPYWFHCVVTVETTLSLNIWSQSDAYLIMEDVYKAPIPFEAHWGTTKLMRCLQYFITLLIQLSCTDDSHSCAGKVNVMAESVRKRYELMTRNGFEQSQRRKLEETVSEYCLTVDIRLLLQDSEVQHLVQGAHDVAEMFRKINVESVREINLGNYIEHLAWRILGSEHLTHLQFYLLKCFSSVT